MTLRLMGRWSAIVFLAVPLPGIPAQVQAPVTAFVNVSVVPMDRERVLTEQTVVVRGDRIAAIGPVGKVRLPANAVQIDGQGKFLLPGLADMHIHLILSAEPQLNKVDSVAAAEREVLLVFLASGITTVRNMGGSPTVLALRDRAAKGEFLSPRIYTAGPMIEPAPASWEEAKRIVVEQQAAGYDFIKLHTFSMPSQVFDTFVAATRRAKIPFEGHTIGEGITFQQWLDGRPRSMEHLYGLDPDPDFPIPAEESEIPARVSAIKRAGVWNCPTLDMIFLSSPFYATGLDTATTFNTPVDEALESRSKIIKILHDSGAGLLLGTDGPGIAMGSNVPRGSLISFELRLLVGAGLTPYQAIETATRNAAVFLGTLDSTGTVEVGKRADLVLLDGNPLTDVRRTAHPAGVMLGGRWLPRATFDSAFAALGLPKAAQ